MDEGMKNNLIAALMVVCLALGLMGQFGGNWLDAKDNDTSTGLTTLNCNDEQGCTDMEMDGMEMGAACEKGVDMMVTAMSGGALTEGSKDDYKENCADTYDTESAGSTGSMILWVGSIAAILCVVVLVLGMAGVEIEQVPEKVPMITMWAAGALTLLAVLVWKLSLPDGDSMEGGMSVWLTLAAGVCGLAAGGMDTFMPGEAAPAAAEEAPAAE